MSSSSPHYGAGGALPPPTAPPPERAPAPPAATTQPPAPATTPPPAPAPVENMDEVREDEAPESVDAAAAAAAAALTNNFGQRQQVQGAGGGGFPEHALQLTLRGGVSGTHTAANFPRGRFPEIGGWLTFRWGRCSGLNFWRFAHCEPPARRLPDYTGYMCQQAISSKPEITIPP